MPQTTGPAIGLSIGSTNLAASGYGRAITRRAVLTMFRHRPPEVGLPSENPRLDERGLVLTDFVDRVGDPVGIVAPDGSSHRGEALLADALRAMAYAVADGKPVTQPPTITYPAHWRTSTVDALRRELHRVPEFGPSVTLITDSRSALVALQADPGVPLRGVIAVCDFGASGTNITLVDATRLTPIGETVRHTDFCGDLVDQALLTRVVADLSAAGTLDVSSTSAIGSLGRLRSACRGAKERLSAVAVTGLQVELPGHQTQVRLTRAELDDAITEPLAEFVAVVEETLRRNGVHHANLVAVASTGGASAVPAITAALSEHLRVPVITPRSAPTLVAAAGAGLWAQRGPEDDSATAMAPAAAASAAAESTGLFSDADAVSRSHQALAWSEDQSVPDIAPPPDYDYRADTGGYAPARAAAGPEPSGLTGARPQLQFAASASDASSAKAAAPVRWYRKPAHVAGAAAAVLLVAGAGIAVALGDYTSSEETPSAVVTATTTPSSAPAVAEPAPTQPAQEAPAPAPATQTVIQQQQVAPQTPVPVASTAPQPAPVEPAPTEPAPAEPAPVEPAPSTPVEPPPAPEPEPQPEAQTPQEPQTPQIPQIPEIPAIPDIPFVPGG